MHPSAGHPLNKLPHDSARKASPVKSGFWTRFAGPVLALWAVAAMALAPVCRAATYYISPSGSDSSGGMSEASPLLTFSAAFARMSAGDELILLDGTYSSSAGTGYINWDDGCATCGQPPSGTSLSEMTYVHAKNPGSVTVDGGNRPGLFLGRSFQKQSFIKIQGITFEGGGGLYNTSDDTIKDCGFHAASQGGGAVFGVGTIDGNWGNTDNLIEDSWMWGQERIIAINYRAPRNVWRRIVIRGDGCGTPACTGSGNPNVGFTVYNSSFTSVQNILVINRILGGASPYADFASAQHEPGPNVDMGAAEFLSSNEWLGCMSLKSEDGGFYFEADEVGDNNPTIRNAVAWDDGGANFNLGSHAKGFVLENLTAGVNNAAGDDGIRVAPGESAGVVRNVIVYRPKRYGVNSAAPPSYADVFGAESSAYNQTTCSLGCKAINPSLKYVTRIENGSPLKGKGFGGGDYGANIVKRYGADDARYKDPGYDALSSINLWPWPNEARIKSEM